MREGWGNHQVQQPLDPAVRRKHSEPRGRIQPDSSHPTFHRHSTDSNSKVYLDAVFRHCLKYRPTCSTLRIPWMEQFKCHTPCRKPLTKCLQPISPAPHKRLTSKILKTATREYALQVNGERVAKGGLSHNEISLEGVGCLE